MTPIANGFEANRLADWLECRLAKPLPGRRAQRRASPGLGYGRHFGPPCITARSAAVLVLLHPSPEGWIVPLTLRPDHLPSHPGQISFAGGSSEPGESPEQTALRELHEELSMPADQVRVVGRLSPLYVYASDFWVVPVVGVAADRPVFRPSPSEVARVIDWPVADLLAGDLSAGEPGGWTRTRWVRHGVAFSTPCLRKDEDIVWGASAMILSELAATLHEAPADVW